MKVSDAVLFILLVIAALLLRVGLSLAHDKGQHFEGPDIKFYLTGLKQPDNPTVSCCGESDMYYADRQEECRFEDGADCAVVAIITDTRPDEPLKRPHIKPGTRVPIPKHKIRRPASANPTGHTIVFVTASRLWVYCYEPLPLI